MTAGLVASMNQVVELNSLAAVLCVAMSKSTWLTMAWDVLEARRTVSLIETLEWTKFG